MITGVTGALGGGKSLTEAVIGFRQLRDGGVWASNIILNESAVESAMPKEMRGRWQAQYFPLQIGEDENGKLLPHTDPSTWPCGQKRNVEGGRRSLICIDESAEWLDAYLPGGTGRVEKICSWLRHSDKKGADVHLIIQHPTMLHKRARALVLRWAMCNDMARFKVPGLGIECPPPLNRLIHRMTLDRDAKTPLDKGEWFTKEKWCYDLYDTTAVYGSAQGKQNVHLTGIKCPPNFLERHDVEWWLYAAGLLLCP